MRIAVVHNPSREGVICQFGQPSPEKYSVKHVQMVADAISAWGHQAAVFEADMNLLARLREFMPPEAVTGRPTGMVFNMAYGIQGDARYTHLPAMLEMAGIPYTGSEPLGHSLAQDKVIAKELMQSAGIPTPKFCVLRDDLTLPENMCFPVVVKPRRESTSYGLRLVQTAVELAEAVNAICEKYEQGALVEEYIEGREVCIGLLGNDPVETMPIVELDFRGRNLRLMTWDDKYHKRADEPEKICPAPLNQSVQNEIQEIARATFEVCHLRDYARVDIRVDRDEKPFVLEINSMASLGSGGSYVFGAKAAGYEFGSLVNRIAEATLERYGFDALASGARLSLSDSA